MVSEDIIARLADFEIDPGDAEFPAIVAEGSRKIAAIYAGLLSEGMGMEAVARAMIGATVSFYDAVGLTPILPELLRVVADKVENRASLPH